MKIYLDEETFELILLIDTGDIIGSIALIDDDLWTTAINSIYWPRHKDHIFIGYL